MHAAWKATPEEERVDFGEIPVLGPLTGDRLKRSAILSRLFLSKYVQVIRKPADWEDFSEITLDSLAFVWAMLINVKDGKAYSQKRVEQATTHISAVLTKTERANLAGLLHGTIHVKKSAPEPCGSDSESDDSESHDSDGSGSSTSSSSSSEGEPAAAVPRVLSRTASA